MMKQKYKISIDFYTEAVSPTQAEILTMQAALFCTATLRSGKFPPDITTTFHVPDKVQITQIHTPTPAPCNHRRLSLLIKGEPIKDYPCIDSSSR